MTWRFDWITSWDEVWDPAFVAQWKTWMEQSPYAHVFFEPCLVRAWYETYRELRNIEPRFLIARRDSESTVFLPLVYDCGGWKDAWQRVIKPVGYSEFDYHDPIVVGDTASIKWAPFWDNFIAEVWGRWKRSVDTTSIARVRGDCVQGCSGFCETNKAIYIELSAVKSLEELLSGRGRNLRHDVRKRQRRLEELGQMRLRIFGMDEAECAKKILPGFLDAHKARWPQAYRAKWFYDRLIENVLAEGILHISVLEVEEETISWHIGYLDKKRFYHYVTAYNERFTKYSPGKVHLAELISAAILQGVEIFDFLTGTEDYKLKWTNKTCPLYSFKCHTTGLGPAVKRYWQKKIRPRLRAAKSFCLGRER